MRTRRWLAALGDERGTEMTEFAIAFTMYMVVVVGAIQVAIWALTSAAASFAMWEGCRAGVAAYQPAPPDGKGGASLSGQQTADEAQEANATFAAIDRSEDVLRWLPVTQQYFDLTASVVEDEIRPGEEGTREIAASVRVRPVILIPLAKTFLNVSPDAFVLERACRLRLVRFYSF